VGGRERRPRVREGEETMREGEETERSFLVAVG
jgi:hypothetical protein